VLAPDPGRKTTWVELSVAKETKILARNHKTFDVFLSIGCASGPALLRKSLATCRYAGSSASEKTVGMVEDDLIELWQRFLKDPRASEAEIRKMSLAALLNKNFRLQLLAWFLKRRETSASGRL
jgi:hypothetical protein